MSRSLSRTLPKFGAARLGAEHEPAVLSFAVQAALPPDSRVQGQFEVMVRHFFDRMLNNEAFGEDAEARLTELTLAIALPGLLVAMFLFPAYHHPPPFHLERSFWSQACDHLFYVTYSFVILGMAMIFQWDMLFPDVLDVYVLTSLPIQRTRMLWGRIAALTIFLSIVQLETSALGNLFLPGVADLPHLFWRHFFAHFAAVSLSGLFAATLFLAIQSVLACIPMPSLANRMASAAKILSVVTLLMIFFLFPLASSSIEALMTGPAPIARFFPPFWFLGVYEVALHGAIAGPVFHALAHTAVWATGALAVVGVTLYPVAYRMRVRQLIEGTGTRHRPGPGRWFRRALDRWVLRTPEARAVFYFTAQTLARLPRLHLYLGMYAGAGLALILSGLIAFRVEGEQVHLVVPREGIRMALPVLAFWTVAGLRTALLSPLGLKGSWLFRVVHGKPNPLGLHAAQKLVFTITAVLTLVEIAVLQRVEPAEMRTVPITLAYLVVGMGLALLLSDLAFLPIRGVPFTVSPFKTTVQLPVTLVTYFVIFPAFCLTVVEHEPWVESSWPHLVIAAAGLAAGHWLLTRLRAYILTTDPPTPEILFMGLGLREE